MEAAAQFFLKKFFFRFLASALSFCSCLACFSFCADLFAAAASRKPKTAFFATWVTARSRIGDVGAASSSTRGGGGGGVVGKASPLGVAGRPEPLGAPSEGAGAELGQWQGGTLAVLRRLANRLALELDAFDAAQVGRAHLERITSTYTTAFRTRCTYRMRSPWPFLPTY